MANVIYVGYNAGAASLINGGALQVGSLYLGNGSTATLTWRHRQRRNQPAAGVVAHPLQPDGGLTGLTLDDPAAGALGLNDASDLDLVFGNNSQSSWIFRGRIPTAATGAVRWQASSLAGRISVTAPDGYAIVDQGGYTYVFFHRARTHDSRASRRRGLRAGGLRLATAKTTGKGGVFRFRCVVREAA